MREERPNLVRSTGIAMAELGTLNGSGKLVTKRTWILRVLLSPLSSFIIVSLFSSVASEGVTLMAGSGGG